MNVQLEAEREEDNELERLSHRNAGYKIEREENGTLTMSPTRTVTGPKSGEAYGQLRDYKKSGAGGKAYDSSTGFCIGPGKRTYAPDASWMSDERINALDPKCKVGYWKVTPNVTIEVKSETDDWNKIVARVDLYMLRGSNYSVAINPQTREVIERGSPPPGLRLDFDAIIDA